MRQTWVAGLYSQNKQSIVCVKSTNCRYRHRCCCRCHLSVLFVMCLRLHNNVMYVLMFHYVNEKRTTTNPIRSGARSLRLHRQAHIDTHTHIHTGCIMSVLRSWDMIGRLVLWPRVPSFHTYNVIQYPHLHGGERPYSKMLSKTNQHATHWNMACGMGNKTESIHTSIHIYMCILPLTYTHTRFCSASYCVNYGETETRRREAKKERDGKERENGGCGARRGTRRQSTKLVYRTSHRIRHSNCKYVYHCISQLAL